MVLIFARAIAELYKQLVDSWFAAPDSVRLKHAGEGEVKCRAYDVATCRRGGLVGDDKGETVDSHL